MTKPFEKLIELNELTRHGEPTIQLVRAHEYNQLHHVKAASEALDYIKDIKSTPGTTTILVLAMSAGEFYGANRNGDAWPERPLTAGPTKITEADVLPKHYKTFETDANIYRHHVNKDPSKRLGRVLKAFYNWPMHRVELLLQLVNKQAEDLVERIEKGEFLPVSMGCKVKCDICSICGNAAPNRSKYCDHAKFQLGDYLPNGKRVFVWNPSPKFFDISIVRRPADRIGFMMKKVADVIEIRSSAKLGEYVSLNARKVAGLRKMSLINKIIKGTVVASKDEDGQLHRFSDDVAKPLAEKMAPLDNSEINSLLSSRPADVLAALSRAGILLTTPEFIKFFVRSIDPTIDIPEEILTRAVAAQQQAFETLADNPTLIDAVDSTGFIGESSSEPDQSLTDTVASLAEKRSQDETHIYRALLQKTARNTTSDKLRPPVYRAAIDPRLPKLAGAAMLLSAVYGLHAGTKKHAAQEFTDYSHEWGELADKVASFETLDIPGNMIRTALDFSHYPEARHLKIAAPTIVFPVAPDFDTVAEQIGRQICRV